METSKDLKTGRRVKWGEHIVWLPVRMGVLWSRKDLHLPLCRYHMAVRRSSVGGGGSTPAK